MDASRKAVHGESAEDKLRAEVERKKKMLHSIYGDAEAGHGSEAQRFKAFVSASKSASKTKLWENDTEDVAVVTGKPVKRDVKTVPNRKPGGKGQMVTKVHLTFAASDESEVDEQLLHEGAESDDLYEDFIPTPATEALVENTSDNLAKEAVPDEHQQERPQAAYPATSALTRVPSGEKRTELSADMIADSGRLFVRNLSYSCTEAELKQLFEPFGPLSELHLSISRETKKPKGFAYVLFMFPEHALRAYAALDGTIFLGRIIHVLPAHERPDSLRSQSDPKAESFKEKKEKDLKEGAQKDYNWNSLFIRSDTVLDAIAAKLGVAKSSIMDVHSSDNLATRLAVAETNLIHETKSYLESEGVVLDTFVSHAERSNTIILVKNLPWDTDTAEIRRLFEKFGSLGRVILPPTKAVALIEFYEATEARTAFKTLAYSKFKHVPLFLEWAPVKSLRPIVPLPKAIVTVDEKADNDAEHDQSTLDAATTLYVKNLNFSTLSDTLKTVFSTVGPVRSAKVASKKTGDRVLSLGFGFVEFERKESLNRALDELQGHVVDGHALLLKRSASRADHNGDSSLYNRKKSEASALDDSLNEQTTKLLVRNIPFEASEKEVRELFKSFAQLKRLRLPRRYDGRHRGFGFVEFLTHQEAVNAKTALSHTHLYGRHLVLEWAKAEATEQEDGQDPLEELRAKTRKRMNISNAGPFSTSGKKVRLDGGDEDGDLYGNAQSSDENDEE